AGSLQMTENFKDAMKDGSSETYQWVLNGIAGGVYSKVPGVVADGYVAQEVEIGGKKYYQVVVADPESPAPASQTTYIVNNTEWNYSVEYKNSSALVITTGNTLKVKGVNVNRTSSEDVSKVTVEAGAKLIVGAEGIQTNSANGLLLKSDAVHGMGMLLYDGSTTATSPYGTAELYLFSKKIADDNYIWQHFGIPTVATPSIEKNVTISVNKWDVKKGWIWDGGSSVLTDAWTGFNIATNHEEAGSIVKFGGQLIGNGDATLVLDKYGYNALANSYTAPVNLKSVIDAVYDASTDGAVWIYSAKEALETGIKQFHSFGSDTPEDESLNPMQAFFVLHESDASDNATISYEDAVLGYNTRAAVANNYNKATLKITGGGEADEFTIYEGEQFSSSIDKGYDIKQMNHDFIQIYAIQNGENYASVATDDAENLELTIKTKAATQYTLSFSGISEGYGVKLTDVKSGAEIEVGNDKTYTFTADANTTAVRFRFGKSEVSADEANADAIKIWSANGSLFVEGNAAEADIEIINLSGVKVASAKASGEAVQAVSISNLASGVYVVRVGNTAAKIVK
ncbi:MAG: T9SS type A sorting domain-containing protein, partial [Paludibacteraceae bacterium]|nr:T9SS type A sorting domain-containing protein [Paludibacteraceae bacterium]